MAKKSKKKTLESTKRKPKIDETLAEKSKQKSSKIFKKLLRKVRRAKEEGPASDHKLEASSQQFTLLPSDEKTQKTKKKFKLPNLPKISKAQLANLNDAQKQKMKGGILSLIGLFLLTFVGVFVLGKVFRPQSLADFLPASSTIGVVEVAIDSQGSQPQKFYEIMQKYPVYQPQGIIQTLNLLFPINYQQDLEPWIGRKLGIVFMEDNSEENSLKTVFFVENKSVDKTMAFLKSRTLSGTKDELVKEDYSGFNIYSYKLSQNYSFCFINNYLVIGENKGLLEQLIDEQLKSTIKLKDEKNYRRIADNLPQGSLVFGYMNTHKLFDALVKNPFFQGQRAKDFMALQPFLKIFSAEGVTVFAEDQQLKVQVFTNIDRTEMAGASYLTYSDKYQGKLLELAGENPLVFMGGHNLHKELNRISEIFQAGTQSSSVIFDGILEYQKQKYLGKDIGLQQDVYPLLQNEYLVTLNNSLKEPQINIFLELSDQVNDLMRIEKIVQAFTRISGIFAPRIQEVTLPDGSKGQEIVADPQTISRSDLTYEGVNIVSLKIGNLPWGIHYAVIDKTFALTTNLDELHTIIDRQQGRNKMSLKNSEAYRQQFEPVFRTADEVFHIQASVLIELMGIAKNQILKPYLAPFGGVTMAKNFFDDGISTIYTVDIL